MIAVITSSSSSSSSSSSVLLLIIPPHSSHLSRHVPGTCPSPSPPPQLQPLRRSRPAMSIGDSIRRPTHYPSSSNSTPILTKSSRRTDSSPSAASALFSPRGVQGGTFTDLINIRVAKLNGFRRVFAHDAPIFFERGIAKPETKVVSHLSVKPCESETLVVTTFEIRRSEIPSFIEREHEFRFLAVTPETFNGLLYTTPSVLCARYSDEEYFRNRCQGSKEIFFQRNGRYVIDKIWLDDILPCRVYLRHCVLAAKNLSDAAYDNFMDHTFLRDRKTTIREYLATSGSGIMEEEPPEQLKHRYGG